MEMKLDYSDVKFKENGKLKLLIIVGTRPEIIRLSAVIKKCRAYFDCILAHTGQNYDYNLNGIFFEDLGLDAPEVYMNAFLPFRQKDCIFPSSIWKRATDARTNVCPRKPTAESWI